MNQSIVAVRSRQNFWSDHIGSANNLAHDQLLNKTVSTEGLKKPKQVHENWRMSVYLFPPQEEFKHVTNGESIAALLENYKEIHHAYFAVAKFADIILPVAGITTGSVVS